MDTEKYIEIQRKLDQGKSPSDEGPYYHHSWWESYKGASKGEMGGTVIGATIGATVGTAVGIGAWLLTGLPLPGIIGTIIGFSAGGIIYGVHKFSSVGAVTGAVAAAQQQAELRMKTFEQGKFAELKQDMHEIKAMISGNSAEHEAARQAQREVSKARELDEQYRKTHYAKLEVPKKNKFIFWKIALVGLAIGLGAGALLAPYAEHLLGALSLFGEGGALATLSPMAISMTALGALGASLGINRDVFRRIFDKTDLWFKGVFHPKHHEKLHEDQIAIGQLIETNGKSQGAPEKIATAVIQDSYINHPVSSTYHRDRVLASAEKALLSFDHTRATPQ